MSYRQALAILALSVLGASPEIALGAGAATRTGSREVWVPIEPGNSWTYAFERNKTRSLNGLLGLDERLVGELHEEITQPVGKFGADAFELRETVRGRIEGGTGQTEETKRSVVQQDGAGYAVLAEEVTDELISTRGLARFQPPLSLLPKLVEVGATWHVGLAQYEGLLVDIEGSVLGIEPLETQAGRFPRCLKVRYDAKVFGEVTVYGVTVPIEAGHYTSTEWFAPGIGRVRSNERTEARLRLASGAALELDQRLVYSLRRSTLLDTLPAALDESE